MHRIFFVEDEESIRELVLYALKSAGFEAYGFECGKALYDTLKGAIPSLLILDIMLPDESGISILKKLRENSETKDLPIIILTAKGSEYDKVKGLELGADDYITKPFSPIELVSRIKAVLRRTTNQVKESTISYKNICIDIDSHIVSVNNKEIELTYKEFELLKHFMKNINIVLSRDNIMEAIWNFGFEGESRTVDMHINTLRKKLGSSGDMIKTIRGVGYKIG